MLTLQDLQEAQARIAPYVQTTPLLPLPALNEALGCQVFVKLENLQTTGAFKLRGALNRALSLNPEELKRGIVCASSGNHGRAIAYAARMLNTHATVVMPFTAAPVKVQAIKDLDAEIVQCETSQRFDVAQEICQKQGATLIPPYNDEMVMAGQGTVGLEIAQQLPNLDALVIPVSGGGLISGVACAIKECLPLAQVWGAEPAVLPRYSKSLAAGTITKVPQESTFADALVSQSPGSLCFPVVQHYVSGVVPVPDAAIKEAMRLLALQGKILAEPSSCIGIAAVLEGLIKVTPQLKVCFLISGGNVGAATIAEILG